MQRKLLGRTGMEISCVTYGGIVSASIYDGRCYAEDGQPISDRQVAWAIEKGINYFDVAPTYGNAQEMLGRSLKPFRRDIYLACKTGKRLRAEAEPEMQESLKLLMTDSFDVYQLHGISTMQDIELAFGPGGVMEMLRDMKEKGIAVRLGITAHSEEVALKALELYDFDTVLFPFNWHMHMAYGMGDRLLKKAGERNMGILCMKSMIERAWTGPEERYASRFPKSWCKPFDPETQTDLLMAGVRYVQALGVHTIVPPGNFDHFSFAVRHIDELLSRPISEEEKALLKQHLEEVREWPFFQVGK